MITSLVILYIGLTIMSAIVIGINNPDIESIKDIDRSKGFLKPYTLTFLSGLITILFFIDSNIIMCIAFLVNLILDIKNRS